MYNKSKTNTSGTNSGKFFNDKGRGGDPNITKRRDDDGPTLNAGLVVLRFFRGSRPALLRTFIDLCFSGGGGCRGGLDPLSASLDLHMRRFYLLSLAVPLSLLWSHTLVLIFL